MLLDHQGAWVLLPMALQILLTLLVFFRLGGAKAAAYRAGSVDKSRAALHDDAWPDSVTQINNSLRNQFELPVLFYALSLSLFVLNAGSWLAVIFAGLFVLTRCVHAVIHLGGNVLMRRRQFFIYGVIANVALLILNFHAIITYP